VRCRFEMEEEILDGTRGGGRGPVYELRKNEGSMLYWRWAEKWTIE
jgi:hypothetical protein